MLFEFDLSPLEAITPWESGGELHLNWFALTDGHYWMPVGGATLFEYSEAARRRGSPHHCNYQVARLHEDLLDAFPHVLEPVPADLVAHLSGEGRWRTVDALSAWVEGQPERDDDAYWATVDHATTWIGSRAPSTAHLSPSMDFVLWSDDAYVHIEWDNRAKLFSGVPAWSAARGSFSLPRADFADQVHAFHRRLMSAMSDRVDRVAAGALPPHIVVDVPGLRREQATRAVPLNSEPRSPGTDWAAVRSALQVIYA